MVNAYFCCPGDYNTIAGTLNLKFTVKKWNSKHFTDIMGIYVQ